MLPNEGKRELDTSNDAVLAASIEEKMRLEDWQRADAESRALVSSDDVAFERKHCSSTGSVRRRIN